MLNTQETIIPVGNLGITNYGYIYEEIQKNYNKFLAAQLAYAKFHNKSVFAISKEEVANSSIGIHGWYKYGIENYPVLLYIVRGACDPVIYKKQKVSVSLISMGGFAKFHNKEITSFRECDVKKSSANICGWYEYGHKHGGPGLRKCIAKKGCKKYHPLGHFIKRGTINILNKTCQNCLFKLNGKKSWPPGLCCPDAGISLDYSEFIANNTNSANNSSVSYVQ